MNLVVRHKAILMKRHDDGFVIVWQRETNYILRRERYPQRGTSARQASDGASCHDDDKRDAPPTCLEDRLSKR